MAMLVITRWYINMSKACDSNQHPCIFMQFYSDCQDHLPPTFREDMKGRIEPVDQRNLSKPLFPFPLFVEVENGRKYVHAEAPDLNFWDWLPYTYSWYPATVTHLFVNRNHAKIFESPELCKTHRMWSRITTLSMELPGQSTWSASVCGPYFPFCMTPHCSVGSQRHGPCQSDCSPLSCKSPRALQPSRGLLLR